MLPRVLTDGLSRGAAEFVGAFALVFIGAGAVLASAPSGEPGLLWKLVLVAMGFGIALTGWMLILTVFLSFLGLPLFMFGLALMQSQER